jgi:hypothetical protein
MKKMLCCGPPRPLPRLIRPVLARASGMRLKREARLKRSIKQTISKEEKMRTTYFARVRSAAVAAFCRRSYRNRIRQRSKRSAGAEGKGPERDNTQ